MTIRDDTKKDIQASLEKSKVWLCPQTQLSNLWFVNAIRGVLHPEDRYDHPIEQYRADQRSSDHTTKCSHCYSTSKVYRYMDDPVARRLEKRIIVESPTYLGMAETPDDPH